MKGSGIASLIILALMVILGVAGGLAFIILASTGFFE